jgi:tetrahydromethanopterin S-methyltransferase subunit G
MAPSVSAAQRLLPVSDEPAEIRRAVQAQAVWLDRQDGVNQTHWGKLTELEGECKDCRGDRRQEVEFIRTRFDDIDRRLDTIAETIAAQVAAGKVWGKVGQAVWGLVVGVVVAAFAWWLR